MNQHAKIKIDRTIVTCLHLRKELTVTDEWTYGPTLIMKSLAFNNYEEHNRYRHTDRFKVSKLITSTTRTVLFIPREKA